MVTSGDQLLWQLRIMPSLQDGATEVGSPRLDSRGNVGYLVCCLLE